MSYIGFWIDKNGVPGRAYLGSLAILININAYILPRVSGITWIGNFLLGCLIFGVLTMIEYCILNYCTCTFNALSIKIEELMIQINNEDLEQEHELKVLDQLRKSGIKRANSKEIVQEIKVANKEVNLQNMEKQASNDISAKEENKSKKPDLKIEVRRNSTPSASKKSNGHSNDGADIDFRDTKKQEKKPQSALVDVRKLNLETEKRTRKKAGDDDLKIIDEMKREDSVAPTDRQPLVQPGEEEKLFKPGRSVAFDIDRQHSVRVKRTENNKLTLDQKPSVSEKSPLKQEFLPISTKNIVIQKLDSHNSNESKKIESFKNKFVSSGKYTCP